MQSNISDLSLGPLPIPSLGTSVSTVFELYLRFKICSVQEYFKKLESSRAGKRKRYSCLGVAGILTS
jgi:hypothetical protein